MMLCVSHPDFEIVISDRATLPAIVVHDRRDGVAVADSLAFEQAAEALFADVYQFIRSNGQPVIEALKAALPAGSVISRIETEA